MHEHDTQSDKTTTNHKSGTVDQQDPTTTERLQQQHSHKVHSSAAQTLDQADQHVQFDEIPFSHDPLYDHRQIYLHENVYMPFGIYENVQATVSFEIELENEKDITHIESSNTAYMHNIGRRHVPTTTHVIPKLERKYIMKNRKKYCK